jgi:hypothetical protein
MCPWFAVESWKASPKQSRSYLGWKTGFSVLNLFGVRQSLGYKIMQQHIASEWRQFKVMFDSKCNRWLLHEIYGQCMHRLQKMRSFETQHGMHTLTLSMVNPSWCMIQKTFHLHNPAVPHSSMTCTTHTMECAALRRELLYSNVDIFMASLSTLDTLTTLASSKIRIYWRSIKFLQRMITVPQSHS